ncbi:hypothetical protein DW352_20060 [Pseudolabrys taiwanensis]|uniref:Uncharacterized protein n=1 Tax=Pseudolabrys taiwanensis TaxID=331696 RepID=A0A346A0B8_9HYPH|nr:hypothetical protein [Pseudolabrys taiwanensis]AXK82615.1 hypothetical protein DW352_20060 [Pseudolabrys taiwanensis]
MHRRWLRPFWTLLALFFLLEAWLWDHLKPLVAWFVDLLPWARLKAALRRTIERLPPYAALAVFVVPFIVLLPLKFLEVYLLASRQWIAAGFVLVLAKLLGLGVTAFVFDATREKLLQMPWFARLYDWSMWARDWAHAQTEPIRQRMHKLASLFGPQRAGRFFRRFLRLRRRAYRDSAA